MKCLFAASQSKGGGISYIPLSKSKMKDKKLRAAQRSCSETCSDVPETANICLCEGAGAREPMPGCGEAE